MDLTMRFQPISLYSFGKKVNRQRERERKRERERERRYAKERERRRAKEREGERERDRFPNIKLSAASAGAQS
jgi:hypothetical protein